MTKWYKVWTKDLSAPVLLIKAETLSEAIKQAKEESPAYAVAKNTSMQTSVSISAEALRENRNKA